jgi:hypothetical protein
MPPGKFKQVSGQRSVNPEPGDEEWFLVPNIQFGKEFTVVLKTARRIGIRSTMVWALLIATTWVRGAHASPDPMAPMATPEPLAVAASREGKAPELELPRESAIENALGRTPAISGSAFGGYGELTLNDPSNAPGVVDMRRFVLFFGHNFTDRIRFYSELELEHAIASSSDQGEAEVEQAYLDGLLSRRINLRGGLILMPMGIVNVYHEPPSFNGVDRPDVDRFIIPSTWREPGFGIFGELAEGLRYQLYFVNGFNANGFTAESAVREGHQEAQLAYAGDYGGIARIDYEPILGTVIGASAYGASSGNTLKSTVGRVPVGLFDVDARFHKGGFSARAEIALLLVGGAGKLNQAFLAGTSEQQVAGPVASQARGGYAEVAYDVLRLFAPSSEQALNAFTRFDYADTQAAVPAGMVPRAEFRRYSQMVGLVYKPVPQIALKMDYRRRWLGDDEAFNELAAAITWLF